MKTKKRLVGVIFGGRSEEYEVSLQSAKNIINTIDKSRFEVVLLRIDKKNQWYTDDISKYSLNEYDPININLHSPNVNVTLIPGDNQVQLINVKNGQLLTKIDVAFPIIHGSLGEDGSLQGMLKMINLPFVGSDVLSSAICMDKEVSKRLLRDAKINVTPFFTFSRANSHNCTFLQISKELGLPLFVKPANHGSSIGVNKVINEAQFIEAVHLAFSLDHKIIIEQEIIGREIECAVIGNDFPQASVCGEIILNGDFYSYEAKYINRKDVQIVIPAVLSREIDDKIRTVVIRAYQTLECTGMARVDVFLTPENEIILNEINTLPGFTNISMYPKLWQASGLNYQDLVTLLIELAIERHTASKSIFKIK